MSTVEIAEATRENFRELVADGLVMVDIWGPECKPCLALIKLEAPKARRVCIDLRVHGLPTFLLMRDGEEVSRLSASQLSPTQLREWLDGQLEVSQAG